MKQILISIAILLVFNAKAQNINLLAGNGQNGYTGNGGSAISAKLNRPTAVAVDKTGNVFIVERDNNIIRKVDTSGIITLVAGTGATGYTGDGGQATSATLKSPCSLFIDSSNNIYVAEFYNHVIRKIDANGIISTIAGNGTPGYSGDSALAINSKISMPTGITHDQQGNIYFTEFGNNVVRKIDTNGIITTIAGNGTYGYSGDGGVATSAKLGSPFSVAVDLQNNVYISDYANSRIRKVDTSGIISTIAGIGSGGGYSGDGGQESAANLNWQVGITVDTHHNLYIADMRNNRIRKIDSAGVIITIVGTGIQGYYGDGGPALYAELNYPEGVTIDDIGNLYIVDTDNDRVRKILADELSGINNISANYNDFNIAPNPFYESANILLNKFSNNVTLKIYNVIGSEVRSINFSGKQYLIEKKDLTPGIYFVQLISENETAVTKKIIIQ